MTSAERWSRHPRFRPDGAAVVYEQFRDGHWEIVELTLDDLEERSLAPNPADDYDPAACVTAADDARALAHERLLHVSAILHELTAWAYGRK